MHDVAVTIIGNVVSDPQERITETGAVVTNFRLAVNPKKYERSSSRWVDGEAMFFNVSCWRNLASNASQSITKGDPVMVHGKLKIRRWDSGERQGTAVEIDAIHIGHDLTRGVASFTRTKRPGAELNQDLLGMDWEGEPGSTAA